MYAADNNFKMSRTGCLLEKTKQTFKPITIEIDDYEYIIELKGCGSPIGAYPDIHDRRQPKTIDRFCSRITGGLELSSGETEYKQLINNELLAHKHNRINHIKSIGYIPFKLFNQDCCVLMRLSPSTIRASFNNNPDINRIQTHKNKAYYFLGKEIGEQLKKTEPILHLNPSLINVVLQEDSYVLTDWAESISACQGIEHLDSNMNIFPVEHFINEMTEIDYTLFFKGISHGNKKFKYTNTSNLFSIQSLNHINNNIIKDCLGSNLYNHPDRINILKFILSQNINYVKSYMPHSYLNNSLDKWIDTHLPQLFKTKLDRLHFVNNLIQKITPSKFFSILNTQNTLDYKSLKKECIRFDPFFLRLFVKEKQYKTHYYTSETLDEKFLIKFKSQNDIIYGIQYCNHILDQLNHFNKTKYLKVPSEKVILNNNIIVSKPLLMPLIFPFYINLIFFLNHQLMINQNALYLSNKLDSTIENNINSIIKNKEILKSNPEIFHSLFKKNPNKLINKLCALN